MMLVFQSSGTIPVTPQVKGKGKQQGTLENASRHKKSQILENAGEGRIWCTFSSPQALIHELSSERKRIKRCWNTGTKYKKCILSKGMKNECVVDIPGLEVLIHQVLI